MVLCSEAACGKDPRSLTICQGISAAVTGCDDVIVPTVEYALWLPCHAVREHVWHPVDPGSSPGGVTTLSLR